MRSTWKIGSVRCTLVKSSGGSIPKILGIDTGSTAVGSRSIPSIFIRFDTGSSNQESASILGIKIVNYRQRKKIENCSERHADTTKLTRQEGCACRLKDWQVITEDRPVSRRGTFVGWGGVDMFVCRLVTSRWSKGACVLAQRNS